MDDSKAPEERIGLIWHVGAWTFGVVDPKSETAVRPPLVEALGRRAENGGHGFRTPLTHSVNLHSGGR